jgi:hypothetical protein
VHSRWNRGNFSSNESADKFIYEPLSGVCLPVGVSHSTFAPFVLPLIFDLAIVILTAVKVFRLAPGLRKQTRAEIVRNILLLILYTLLNVVLDSSIPYSGMGFCTYNCERTSALPLTANRPQVTLSSLSVHQIVLSPFPAHEKYSRSLFVYGIPLFGQSSLTPLCIWGSTHIGVCFLRTLFLFPFARCLTDTTSIG